MASSARLGWRSETADQLMAAAARSADGAERLRLCRLADRLAVDEAIYIPLSYGTAYCLTKPWAKVPTGPGVAMSWAAMLKAVVIEPH